YLSICMLLLKQIKQRVRLDSHQSRRTLAKVNEMFACEEQCTMESINSQGENLDGREEKAAELFQEAYRAQIKGDIVNASRLYQESIQIYPTAEAHTFLGWVYSSLHRYEDAIQECKKAIAVDQEFGNPYNDIGSYLMKLGKLDEAIPWLEQAKIAKRYAA